jgi:hypothetical protein
MSILNSGSAKCQVVRGSAYRPKGLWFDNNNNNNNNNDNLNTPGSRTVSSCEQYGTNLRRGLARDPGKWLTEIVSFKPALESLE